jgi:plasmid stability protein
LPGGHRPNESFIFSIRLGEAGLLSTAVTAYCLPGIPSLAGLDIVRSKMLSLIAKRKEQHNLPAVTVRNLPESTHRALKLRAARNGRSTEAEIRRILQDSVSQKPRLKIGSELAAFGHRYGGIELNYKRDRSPIEPAKFE